MAELGDRFADLKWYASWESPFVVIEGDYGNIQRANPFVDPKTGEIDFRQLRYSATARLLSQGPSRGSGASRVLYLDTDGDGEFTAGKDFAFQASVTPGPPPNVFYSPTVLRAALKQKVFGSAWPVHIASPEQSEKYIVEESATRFVGPAVKRFPQLSVLVLESEQNHTDDAPFHPMPLAQVNAFLDAAVKWVRLNPDRHYLAVAMGRATRRVVQNPAGQRLRAESIRQQVVPEDVDGGPTDKELATAGLCELADRTYRDQWAPTLGAVLVNMDKR